MGLGISNSGSEADQCVTAESFNLSLIMAAFLHPLQRPAAHLLEKKNLVLWHTGITCSRL